MILLSCRFQNHASHRGRRAFSQKMRPGTMRKYGNLTLKPCDKADDGKYSFPKGAINKKYSFFQWILQISGCNRWCKKGAYGPNWGAQEHIFHESAFVPLSKSCFPPRAGSIFSENTKVLAAWTAQRKQRIV